MQVSVDLDQPSTPGHRKRCRSADDNSTFDHDLFSSGGGQAKMVARRGGKKKKDEPLGSMSQPIELFCSVQNLNLSLSPTFSRRFLVQTNLAAVMNYVM